MLKMIKIIGKVQLDDTEMKKLCQGLQLNEITLLVQRIIK